MNDSINPSHPAFPVTVGHTHTHTQNTMEQQGLRAGSGAYIHTYMLGCTYPEGLLDQGFGLRTIGPYTATA